MGWFTRQVPTDFPWKLIEDITNGFALEQKIGSGGYGVVYKGVQSNGQEVAVKKLHHMPGLDEDQFQNELRILTGVCHPNIVQLVGKSYIERDRCVEYQDRLVFATMIDRAICLEFLPNGSLEKHLSDERSGLHWHCRYKIIKGICDGLKYLHGERIFHLDLKPSNILLDKDMVPKIGDFGLSRLFNGTRHSHTTKNLLCTLGYAPPEFVDKGKITNKFDVFSLGVIMIKVLAGPDGYSAFSDMSDSQDFIDLVQGNWRERLMDRGWKDALYLDAYCNQVKTCTVIALKCVETNSHKRPSIEDIISMLNDTEETIDKLYRQLFVVEPSHLCFLFEPDRLIPCPVHLTNNADHYIAYRMIQPPNTPDIIAGSLQGIVPARCTRTCILTMQKQGKPPPNLDTIHIQSAVAYCLDLFSVDSIFDNAEVVHDERKVVKITSLYECASPLASKPRIEVLALNRSYYAIDAHPLEPWVLITLGEARGIEIWNYKTRAELDLSDIIPLRKDVLVAKFVARNQWFVAGYSDGYMDVFCYKTMQRLKQFETHQSELIDLAVHPTEPYVLSVSLFEGNVKLWDWEKSWECTRIFQFVDFSFVDELTFLSIKDTDTFAVPGNAGIKICSLRSPGSAEFILSEYKDRDIKCFGYFANGDQQYLITGGYGGTVKIWDMHTENLVETVEGVHSDGSVVNAICCHPEHPVLLTGSQGGTVCLWNPTTLM